MMDGKNSSGCKVSLLNDNDVAPTRHASRPSISSQPPSLNSRASSIASTPSLGPQTPPLVRSASEESTGDSPSPITPADGFDQTVASPPLNNDLSYLVAKNTSIRYAQLPPNVNTHPEVQAAYYNRPPLVQHTSGRVSSAPKAPTKKNQYPCPVAKQYNCPDYFTTSGHAARHAKKHTGRKDAKCPECNKAFTRKDNMEQHRRTHQNGRGSGKHDESRIKKMKPSPKRPKPAPLQPSLSLSEAASPNCVDSPPQASSSYFRFPSSFSLASYRSFSEGITPGVTNGLDALAIAASEQ